MTYDPVTDSYDELTERKIDEGGREHHSALDHLRYLESIGRDPGFIRDSSHALREEAEQTAQALGF
jgi:hypothetical protein